MKSITIRPALPEDWQIIQKLNDQVFQSEAPNDDFIDLSWPQTLMGKKYYQDVCTNPEIYTLIAYKDDQPVGYITASARTEDYRTNKPLEINNMGVAPEFRSTGIGTALVNEIKTKAKQAGFTHIFVVAYAKNTSAHRFYQRQGLMPLDISFEGKI